MLWSFGRSAARARPGLRLRLWLWLWLWIGPVRAAAPERLRRHPANGRIRIFQHFGQRIVGGVIAQHRECAQSPHFDFAICVFQRTSEGSHRVWVLNLTECPDHGPSYADIRISQRIEQLLWRGAPLDLAECPNNLTAHRRV